MHLAVEVEQIETVELDLDLDVLNLDVLALTPRQLLERQDTLLLNVPRDGFAVEDGGRRVRTESLSTDQNQYRQS